MTRTVPLLLSLLFAVGCAARPAAPRLALSAPGVPAPAWADEDEEDDVGPVGVAHTLLLYLPNRIFDVLDIVRARVRVGPGVAVDVRATELADLFVGSYGTVYVGLPGPRGRRIPVLPAGFETRTGVEASVADVTAEGALGPDYGLAEVGLGLQLFLIGFDVGVDVFEVGDLVLGLFTIDPMDDDL